MPLYLRQFKHLTLGVLMLSLPAGSAAWGEPYPLRWVRFDANFSDDARTQRGLDLVKQAGELGLNGIVVNDGKLFTLDLFRYGDMTLPRGRQYRHNLAIFVKACQEHGLEVIPQVFNPSEAKPLLGHDPNLAAGYEVRGALFEVRDRVARLVPDPEAKLANAGFEASEGQRFSEWSFQDRPGQATQPDRYVKRIGRQSVRLEAAAADEHGHCRVIQWVKVTPRRCYRISVWVKTDKLTPPGSFNVEVYGEGTASELRPLTYNRFDTAATQSWTQVHTVFNSLDCERVKVHIGLWGARGGRAWLDDAELTEIGLVNVLRRPGCPITVTSPDGQTLYRERYDFEPVADPRLGQARWPGTYDCYHEAPALRMRPDFPDGERLSVSFYHPLIIYGHQVTCCLTEDRTFEMFERQFVQMVEMFRSLDTVPRRFFMTFGEHRTGGGCAACKATGKTPGRLFAEAFHRCAGIVRQHCPGAEIMAWHDMFDPAANARPEYYLMEGPMTGTWEGLDREVIVAVWDVRTRDRSLRFFAERGHRLMASADYDKATDPARFTETWLRSMDATPGVCGILYAGWGGRYDSLATFARIVGAHQRPTAAMGGE